MNPMEAKLMLAALAHAEARARALSLKGKSKDRDRKAVLDGAMAVLVSAGLMTTERRAAILIFDAVGRLDSIVADWEKANV